MSPWQDETGEESFVGRWDGMGRGGEGEEEGYACVCVFVRDKDDQVQ